VFFINRKTMIFALAASLAALAAMLWYQRLPESRRQFYKNLAGQAPDLLNRYRV
jgi:hypothetical protein